MQPGAGLPSFEPGQRLDEALNAGTLNDLRGGLQTALAGRNLSSSSDIVVRRGGSNVSFRFRKPPRRGGGASLIQQFIVTRDPATGNYTIGGGTVSGNVPSSMSGTCGSNDWVWIQLTETLSVANGFCYSTDFSAVTTGSGSSVPADDEAGGVYYLPLAQFIDDARVQYETTSLDYVVKDAGKADGSARIYWDRS